MERAVGSFMAITVLVIGASCLLRPGDWAEAFRQLHRCSRAGAFVNGGLSLTPDAAIVAGHNLGMVGVVIAGFGWLLAPGVGLRSIARGADRPRGFVVAGVLALTTGGWACYCIWVGAQQSGCRVRPGRNASLTERFERRLNHFHSERRQP